MSQHDADVPNKSNNDGGGEEVDVDVDDFEASIVRQVLAENPPEERGERDEWAHHTGWHRKEDVLFQKGVTVAPVADRKTPEAEGLVIPKEREAVASGTANKPGIAPPESRKADVAGVATGTGGGRLRGRKSRTNEEEMVEAGGERKRGIVTSNNKDGGGVTDDRAEPTSRRGRRREKQQRRREGNKQVGGGGAMAMAHDEDPQPRMHRQMHNDHYVQEGGDGELKATLTRIPPSVAEKTGAVDASYSAANTGRFGMTTLTAFSSSSSLGRIINSTTTKTFAVMVSMMLLLLSIRYRRRRRRKTRGKAQ